MPPGRRAERDGIVVRHAAEMKPVIGKLIPLLARNFARLAADAQRRIGEESLDGHQFPSLVSEALNPCAASGFPRTGGRSRSSARSSTAGTSAPLVTTRRFRLLRPASIVAVNAFDSWMDTLGSAINPISSFAASPRTMPLPPQ